MIDPRVRVRCEACDEEYEMGSGTFVYVHLYNPEFNHLQTRCPYCEYVEFCQITLDYLDELVDYHNELEGRSGLQFVGINDRPLTDDQPDPVDEEETDELLAEFGKEFDNGVPPHWIESLRSDVEPPEDDV